MLTGSVSKQVYLAGPSSENSSPWHERVMGLNRDIDWINPFEIHPPNPVDRGIFRRDLEAVADSDAVLLRRIADYNLCGASMEAFHAYQNGIPVVVWNDADGRPPLFLRYVAKCIEPSPERAVGVLPNLWQE